MEEVRIPYKPRILIMLLAALFFTACSVILGLKSFYNDQGLVLNGLITFSENGASIFYWCLTGLSIAFVIAGAFGVYASIASRKVLVLTDQSISAPRSTFSNKSVSILYSDVDYLEMQEIQRERLLSIFAKDGRKLVIAQSLLPSKQVFEQVVATVRNNVGAYVV